MYPDIPFDKGKAWVEMIHRYFASGLGLLAIVITVIAWLGKQPLKLPVVFLILVVVQGAFGAWTVTLKLWPQVVTAHLLGGSRLALVGLLRCVSGWDFRLSLPRSAMCMLS